MLYPANDYLLYVIRKETLRQFHREAESNQVLEELCPRQSRGLGYPIRKALHSLGHAFLVLGQRLDRIETHATQGYRFL